MPIPLGVLAAAGAGGAALTNDYELIETFEAASNTSSVTFSSIPQTYKHLQIRHSIRSGQSGAWLYFRMTFNGVTTSSYSTHILSGDGSSVTRDLNSGANYLNAGIAAGAGAGGTNRHGGGIIDILDYTSTAKKKTVRNLGGAATTSGSVVVLTAGFYDSTNAITQIDFSTVTPGEFLFAGFQGTSRISLYGIKG